MPLDIEKCKECYYADEDGVCGICCVENAMFEPKRPNERVLEWISVKDKLPKSGKRVLAFDNFGKIFFSKWLGGVGCWINEKHNVVHVTHWMPLPEPPKGDDNAAY